MNTPISEAARRAASQIFGAITDMQNGGCSHIEEGWLQATIQQALDSAQLVEGYGMKRSEYVLFYGAQGGQDTEYAIALDKYAYSLELRLAEKTREVERLKEVCINGAGATCLSELSARLQKAEELLGDIIESGGYAMENDLTAIRTFLNQLKT